MTNPPRRALVTGASSGIGAAFARELTRRGCDLVLTARREDRLRALADELHAKHGIDAQVIVGDLSQPEAPRRIVEEIARRGLHIDILVNNAGYGVPGDFLASDCENLMRYDLAAAYKVCFGVPGTRPASDATFTMRP